MTELENCRPLKDAINFDLVFLLWLHDLNFHLALIRR